MLSFRVLPRGIAQFYKKSSSRIHTSIQVLSSKDPPLSSDSSSSSDSSDSDSDREGKRPKKQIDDKGKETSNTSFDGLSTNERLNTLLEQIAKQSTKSDKKIPINVAIKPKNMRLGKPKEQINIKKKPFEEQLIGAAKDIAKEMGGDTQKTELELLSQVLNLKAPTPDEEAPKTTDTPSDLSGLLQNMKVDRSVPQSKKEEMKMSGKVKQNLKQASVAESLLYAKSQKIRHRNVPDGAAELKKVHSDLGILKHLSKEQAENIPPLSTWEAMERREIELATLSAPQNVFEELILWTEQGKIWHFPINNEQGMESENNVHFSEHVFMERHLKGWCPRKGPIRHFMELVCTGLSKNPYMTVEEKVEHITWYKNYFEDKSELLSELGLIDDNTSKLTSESKKQIEA